jgi:hypothetical protein
MIFAYLPKQTLYQRGFRTKKARQFAWRKGLIESLKPIKVSGVVRVA